MILRRLVAHLKDQNWTAIVIEFVLLVGGVFLGIEVSNWNQEREQRNKACIHRPRADIRYELGRTINDRVLRGCRSMPGWRWTRCPDGAR
jgi:hypothetical protein